MWERMVNKAGFVAKQALKIADKLTIKSLGGGIGGSSILDMRNKSRNVTYLLILDVVFVRGRCTIRDIQEEMPDKTIKTIQIYLRELNKLNLIEIDSQDVEESVEGKIPHNLYSLKCRCPLPNETDNCGDCPSGKLIRNMENSV